MDLTPYENSHLNFMPPRESERHILEREPDMHELRMRGPAWTLWTGRWNTEPIGAAGIIIFRKGVGEAWLRGSTRMAQWPMAAARYTRRMLGQAMAANGLHRVQITVRMTDARAIRFALWLGFELEGVMRGAGEDSEDHYLMMSIVRKPQAEACATGGGR